MTTNIRALQLFVRVARTGSFSKAGKEVNLPQSSVSRIVAALEQELGVALLRRSTRAVTPTEAGADYLELIEPIIAALDDASQAVRGTCQLRGMLRISVSSSVAFREVIPRLPVFLQTYPGLQTNVLIDDRRHDLVAEGVDVALRAGPIEDNSLQRRKLTTWRRIAVASPSYLEKAGTPTDPYGLDRLDIIGGSTGDSRRWPFKKGEQSILVTIKPRLSLSNNEAAVEACVAGMGVASVSESACRKEISRGRLVRILDDWSMGEVELHAIFTGTKPVKASARAFTEFLVQQLSAD